MKMTLKKCKGDRYQCLILTNQLIAKTKKILQNENSAILRTYQINTKLQFACKVLPLYLPHVIKIKMTPVCILKRPDGAYVRRSRV